MKTVTLISAVLLSGILSSYGQRSANIQTNTSNANMGSTNVNSSRFNSDNKTVTNNSNDNANNNNNWSINNNSSNNSSSNNSNSNTNWSNNNNYYNNNLNNGYTNNGYYNSNYNNNQLYTNSNNNYTTQNQNSYKAVDENYGNEVSTVDKNTLLNFKNQYNISDMRSNYRNGTNIDRLFTKYQQPSQIFIIDAQAENTLKGTDGTILKIAPNSFVTKNGELVKGDVEFEMKEIYDRSDMVLSNAHTVCNDLPLESGGELYLGATRNSEPLILAADKNILIEMPARSNKEMQLFNGMPDRNSVNWNVANPNTVTPVLNSNSATGSSYNFSTTSMNWINCDKFMRSNASNTKINVRVPKQFDTTNTAVFIVFAGQNTVTKFDHFTRFNQLSNESDRSTFDTRWYTVPVGAEVTIVAISEVDGQVFSSIQPTKIMKDQVAELEFNPTTMDEFKNKMYTLP